MNVLPFWKNRILPVIGSASSTVMAALLELSLLQRILFVAVFWLGFGAGRLELPTTAYRSVQEIPSRYFGPDAPLLRGHAVSVSDGDTIRFYHLPLPWLSVPDKLKISESALAIRVCTIDTPETPKFGKPGQPFGEEAKQALQQLVEGRKVRLRLLQTDQYGRAVAQVLAGRGQYADEVMLRQGLAEVYEGAGAVYGPKGKQYYLDLQEQARTKEVGIWSLTNRESAAEYKKRTK
jgi:endonuclease YncB( thermonuclease family)